MNDEIIKFEKCEYLMAIQKKRDRRIAEPEQELSAEKSQK